jgi:hypothetical protein
MKSLAPVLLVLLAVTPAAAQVEIKGGPPGPEAEFRIDPPSLYYETTRPGQGLFYPTGPRVLYEPAFIEPFAVKWETPTQSGEAGVSGWTSPNQPVGGAISGYSEVTGWLGLGFSITWDGPPPRKPAVR